jgi:hypothetical protein
VSDTFAVRVFPNVYLNGDSGAIENDLTVQRTWNIVESTPGGSSVSLTLQHNAATEGSAYTRTNQYVSRYFGQTNNAYRDTSMGNFWDYASPSNGYANSIGTITTGAGVGYEATRYLPITTTFSKDVATRYFTKASTTAPIPVSLIFLTAIWQNTEKDAKIMWATATEINNMGFDVQRSYDGVSWNTIYFLASNVMGGNSTFKQDYSYLDQDLDPNKRIVYYRIVQKDYNGINEIFGPKTLVRKKYSTQLVTSIYPNPAKNILYLNLDGQVTGLMNIEIVDVLGQTIHKQIFNKENSFESTVLDVSSFSKGNYWIQIQSQSNTQLYIKPIQLLIAR